MADAEIPQKYSPELSEAMLAQIQKNIERNRQQQIAQAQGAAVTRGITGGSFEARGIGAANMGAQDASTQAALNIAIQNADYATQQKQLQQTQTFQAGEAEKNRLFGTSERIGTQTFSASQQKAQNDYNDLERQKQEAFAAGQTDKANSFAAKQAEIERQFQIGMASTAYERQKSSDSRNNRQSEINSGIQAVGEAAGIFCFFPNSLVQMADGSIKSICLVDVGDETKGGTVLSVRKTITPYVNDAYYYKGIYVMGSHEIKENGKWKYVRDSKEAVYVPMADHFETLEVYTLITSSHRIYVMDFDGNFQEFMDECVKDTGYSLEDLNKTEVISHGK